MLTIPQMAQKSNAATATVVRTAQSLGFSSYSALKNALKEAALNSAGASYSSFMHLQKGLIAPGTPEESIRESILSCKNSISALDNPEFIQSVIRAVDILLAARHVYTLGIRSGESIMQSFQSSLFGSPISVIQLGRQPEYVFDYLMEMTEKDVLLAVASHPAAKKTADAIRICQDRGVPIVVITNSKDTPCCRYATHIVSAECLDNKVLGLPIYFIAELLGREIARRTAFSDERKLEQIDEVLQRYDIVLWDR